MDLIYTIVCKKPKVGAIRKFMDSGAEQKRVMSEYTATERECPGDRYHSVRAADNFCSTCGSKLVASSSIPLDADCLVYDALTNYLGTHHGVFETFDADEGRTRVIHVHLDKWYDVYNGLTDKQCDKMKKGLKNISETNKVYKLLATLFGSLEVRLVDGRGF